MNLQEQISRIQSMMWINESMSKKEFLFSYLDKNGFDSRPIKKILSISDEDWSKYIREYLGDNYDKVIKDEVTKLVENFTECDGDVFRLRMGTLFFEESNNWLLNEKVPTYTVNLGIYSDSPVFETVDLGDNDDVLVLLGQIEGCVEKYLNDTLFDKYGVINNHTFIWPIG